MAALSLAPRYQRLLLIGLVAYFVLFGGSVYTEHNPALRVAHQAFGALLFALWLVDLWRAGRGFPRTPLDGPVLIYLGAWLAIALAARDPRVSLEYLWPLLTRVLGFYLLVDVIRRGRQRWVMEALFLVGGVVLVLSAVELAAWYFGLPLVPGFVQGWPQVFGLTIPPEVHRLALALTVSTWVGSFAAVLVPLAAVWALTAVERGHRRGLWLLAGGLLIVLLLSGSRGAMVGLGVAVGALGLFWLLRADVRARLPAALRPLLNGRLLLAGAVIVGAAALAVVLRFALGGGRSGDVNRLDLWRSALMMAADRPALGVGLFQYGAALRDYGSPERTLSQDHLLTAHNLPLHTLAEGGAVGFAVSLGLAGAFALAWWRAWRGATDATHRRRLEGALAALVVFGVHNLFDTFPLTPLYVAPLICAAYVVASAVTRAQAVTQAQVVAPGRRGLVAALLALLVVAQVAFTPVHAGDLAHGRAVAALNAGDAPEALAQARAARAADPWLGLYPAHEAYILGLLAEEDPDAFLPEAIAAHERALARNPTWDQGWHNLGALYARAGRYDDAVAAAQAALDRNPVPAGYYLKLGEHHEAAGREVAARAAYIEALRRSPDLASSGFWRDPARPARAYVADDPAVGLRLALAAGDLGAATAIALQIDRDAASDAVLRQLASWAARLDDAEVAPCPACYYEAVRPRNANEMAGDYVFLAELALRGDGVARPLALTAEEAARAALFVSGGSAARAWYVLAQLAERAGADAATVDDMLARAVPPLSTRLSFGISVYGRVAVFDDLPSAQTPMRSHRELEPWLVLLDRLEAAGEREGAQRVCEALLRADPYLWDVRQRLERLRG